MENAGYTTIARLQLGLEDSTDNHTDRRTTLRRMKAGEENVRRETFEEIAQFLNVDPISLVHPDDIVTSYVWPETWLRGSSLALALSGLAIVGVIGYLGVFTSLFSASKSDEATAPIAGSIQKLELPDNSLILIADSTGKFDALVAALSEALETEHQVGLRPDIGRGVNGFEALRQSGARALINVELLQQGRYWGVQLFLYTPKQRLLLLSRPVHPNWAAVHQSAFVTETISAISSYKGGSEVRAPSTNALEVLLYGLKRLDQAASTESINAAHVRFTEALDLYPDWSTALAGRCETYLKELILSSEASVLELAALACENAGDIDASDPFVRMANVGLKRRQGDHESAIELAESLLQDCPACTDVAVDLAESLSASRIPGDNRMAQALQTITTAEAQEPDYWLLPFEAARMHYFNGDLTSALAASDRAWALSENERVLGNMGTYAVCAGDFEVALRTYLRAHANAGGKGTSLTNAHVCTGYSFLQKPQEALPYCQQALKLAQADGAAKEYKLLGNLAETQLALGNLEGARQSFTSALKRVRAQDQKSGDRPATLASVGLYYRVRIALLSQSASTAELLEELAVQEPKIDSAQANMMVAAGYYLLGERDKGQQLRDRMPSECPGLAVHPAFDQFK